MATLGPWPPASYKMQFAFLSSENSTIRQTWRYRSENKLPPRKDLALRGAAWRVTEIVYTHEDAYECYLAESLEQPPRPPHRLFLQHDADMGADAFVDARRLLRARVPVFLRTVPAQRAERTAHIFEAWAHAHPEDTPPVTPSQ